MSIIFGSLADVRSIAEHFQVEHPDRVAWYHSLIHQWSSQAPSIMIEDDLRAVVWVNPYTSQAGLIHAQPTGVRAETVEDGLEHLANILYEDYQSDLAYLQRGVAMRSSVLLH